MRSIIRIQNLALLVGLTLGACTRSPVDRNGDDLSPTPAAAAMTAPASAATTEAAPEPDVRPAETVALACTPPQRACPRCNGSGSFCTSSRFCPECAPQDLAPKAEEPIAAAPTCPPGQHLFTNCKGERVCAPRPFECAPPLAPEPGVGGAETVALACTPPERSCIACDGSSHYCARRCFECAPQLAPKADEPGPVLADLVPVTESCGGTLCAPGTHCCNPTCGICTPKGVNCTQQTCN